ncbi:MAG: DNA repair protein RecO, partial [Shewanella sp.]
MKRGYVLHHRPYRESSALVNLLVDGIGRVDAVARVGSGKRSIKSILQPFQPLIFEFS